MLGRVPSFPNQPPRGALILERLFLCREAGLVWGTCSQSQEQSNPKNSCPAISDKGGAAQISTATRVLAEIIASDLTLLVTFNHAIDSVIHTI